MSMMSIVFVMPVDKNVNGGRFVCVIMWSHVSFYYDLKIYYRSY